MIYDTSIRSVPIEFEDQKVLQARENGYQIALIYVRSDEIVAPIFYMRMPKIGGGTRMKYLDIIRAAGNRQSEFYYADDTEVSKIIFLVQGIAMDKRGWRIHEVDASQGIQSVKFPPLDSLTPIEDTKDHQEYLDVLNIALESRFDLNK